MKLQLKLSSAIIAAMLLQVSALPAQASEAFIEDETSTELEVATINDDESVGTDMNSDVIDPVYQAEQETDEEGTFEVAQADTEDSFSANMGNDELDANRGGEDVTLLLNQQRANVLGNSMNGNSVTGSTSIGDSFNNASGAFLVIQNTGNLVSINGSMIVDVRM